MTSRPPGDGRRGRHTAAAVAVVLLALAAWALVLGLRGNPGPPQPSDTAAASSVLTVTPEPTASTPADRPDGTAAAKATRGAGARVGAFMAGSEPVRLDIPAIGVHSRRLVGLHVGPDGALEAPARFDEVGWYTGGPTPGQLGPAVIGGHVDSRSGPAVFYRLGELHTGNRAMVTRRDGTVATFVIDRVTRFAKAAFPTQQVYGNPTDRAEIRLITCGGAFDRSTGHYVDNIVAFGHLATS